MPHAAFVIPGDIDMASGGYGYDRRVLALLPEAGVGVSHVALPASFPSPTAADLAASAQLMAAAPAGSVLLIDGLAYGAMPAALVAAVKHRIVALVHHPLCLEAGLSPARQDKLRKLETEALTFARHVVVTSPLTARTLAQDFAVPAERITVAVPGTDPAARARGTRGPGKQHPLAILAVGSIIPRKGYDLMIEALAPLKSLSWRLDIAGGLDLAPDTTRALRAQIEAKGLADRVTLLGAVDQTRLSGLYDTADLFVLSSHYEGFGMVLTEALARGLPIVCTTGGAAAETLPDDAALKVQPGDVRALMWTVGRAIEDGGIRSRVADAAWAAAGTLPRWPETARRIADVIKEVAA